MTDVQDVDLRHPQRTVLLLADAQRRGLIGASEFERLRFFTTAAHAIRHGTEPCTLFAALARKRCWSFGSHEDEDLARRALRQLDLSPQTDSDPLLATAPVERRPSAEKTMPTASTPWARPHPPLLTLPAQPRPRSAGPSSNSAHDLRSAGEILLGIDLGHAHGTVPKHDPDRLDAKLLAEVRRRAVSELVG